VDVFGGTRLAWAFIGEGIPQVRCHDPHLRSIQKMGVAFGGKRRHLEGRYIALIYAMFDLGRSKRLSL
jgi:hypothetical protein